MPQLKGVFVALGGVVVGVVPIVLTHNPAAIRLAVAVAIVVCVVSVSLVDLRLALLLTLWFLPFLALIRRLLIPIAGWSSYDPLLLVAPAVAAVLLYQLFIVQKRRLTPEWVSRAVLVLMLVAIIQVVNPAGGGLAAGATGLLFIAAPLAWFFVGRELADRRLVARLLVGVAVIAVGIAGYGLWQNLVGLPVWDSIWVDLNGYAALSVFGTTRAFGTFSSGAEYAIFLAGALVIAVAMALRGRAFALLFIPVLAVAVFLESSRTIVFVILVAVVGVVGLRTGSKALTGAGLGLIAVLVLGVINIYGSQLTATAEQSGNPFVAHQVAGLMNPFNASQSTLLIHEQLVANGVLGTLAHPIGFGTSATNLAGQKLGSGTNSAEVDVIDAFISLGIIGGTAFLAIVFLTLWRSITLGIARRDLSALAATALLIITFGQWLNGGYYALAPLVWTLVGWTTKESLAEKPVPSVTSSATAKTLSRGRQFPATGWSS